MEYLDPKKQKQHLIRLIVGYVLMTIALLLTTTVLLYYSYGFGLKNGEVIQSGLIFVSSRPVDASIIVNGERQTETTNTRLLMSAGQYTFELQRSGYVPWKRAINVEGGAVVRFDYPVLFPKKLTTDTVKSYDAQPPLTLQSPDRRWFLVQSPSALATFDAYDLEKPEEAPETVTVPAEAIGLQTGLHRWSLAEWARDNRHVLLLHTTEQDGVQNREYILLDRDDPAQTVNVTRALGVSDAVVSLHDKKHDKYYVYDAAAQTVVTASLEEPASQPLLQNVLAFKSYGDDVLLYATGQNASEGKAVIKLREGDRTDMIRQVAVSGLYLLDVARYDNAWYVAVGGQAENKVYVYKNPAAALRARPDLPVVPVQVLKATNTQALGFSDNARFIMAQGGSQVAVYDAETDRGYNYHLTEPLDAPQTALQWMDGHRLMGVTGGKVAIIDFDNSNRRQLVNALPAFEPVFDREFSALYALTPQTTKAANGTETTRYVLTTTSLLTPQDQ